jgi:hypothetical protein
MRNCPRLLSRTICWWNKEMSALNLSKQEFNLKWCKQWNQGISKFLFEVMCYENPKPQNCEQCPKFGIKHSLVQFFDCPKEAMECLRKHCDYASASDSIFECTRQKGRSGVGCSTTVTFQSGNREGGKGTCANELEN